MTLPQISAAVTLLQPRSISSGRLISLTPRYQGELCISLVHILDVYSPGGWWEVYGQPPPHRRGHGGDLIR
jgi:hypothetical protein